MEQTTEQTVARAVHAFTLAGNCRSCEPYGEGHINRTYLITTDAGPRYILQRLSRAAFHNIPQLMENVAGVTRYLEPRLEEGERCLHLVPTVDGNTYYLDEDGEFWRLYDFLEGTVCLQQSRTPEDFYQSAVAFGTFQRHLRDYPSETLHETIPNFHNTPDRYRQFKESLAADPLGRVAEVAEEIRFILDREADGSLLQNMRDNGTLPTRVTHNDTKLNNVMFDEVTGKGVCVIDLDTVMPGLLAYDFGDAIRFGASTAREDETDLDKVRLALSLYETYLKGFLSACGELSAEELRSLPLGAKTLTLENALRFLKDYIDGDVYYQIARPTHNLDRARTQIKLVSEMEAHWDEMLQLAESYL